MHYVLFLFFIFYISICVDSAVLFCLFVCLFVEGQLPQQQKKKRKGRPYTTLPHSLISPKCNALGLKLSTTLHCLCDFTRGSSSLVIFTAPENHLFSTHLVKGKRTCLFSRFYRTCVRPCWRLLGTTASPGTICTPFLRE